MEKNEELADSLRVSRQHIVLKQGSDLLLVLKIMDGRQLLVEVKNQLLDDDLDDRPVRHAHVDKRADHRRLEKRGVLFQRRQQRAQQLVQLRLDSLAQNGEDARQELGGGDGDDLGGQVGSVLVAGDERVDDGGGDRDVRLREVLADAVQNDVLNRCLDCGNGMHWE